MIKKVLKYLDATTSTQRESNTMKEARTTAEIKEYSRLSNSKPPPLLLPPLRKEVNLYNELQTTASTNPGKTDTRRLCICKEHFNGETLCSIYIVL